MPAVPKPTSTPRRAISIPPSAWDRIVSQLDQQGQRQRAKFDTKPQRETRVRHTRVISCVLRLKQDGSPPAVFKVTTRNFSGGGLGFFFHQYLHAGTVCHFAVIDRHGVGRILEGQIRWCRHVSDNLHECGVQFALPVDPQDFVEAQSAADADQPSPPAA
ncbi:MAG: PilZ domain-containing protein [Planctomycetota bacterium]